MRVFFTSQGDYRARRIVSEREEKEASKENRTHLSTARITIFSISNERR
jgi:hypothetical protein